MKEMYIVSFNSTHHAIRSEKLIKEHEVAITMLPTPREISASCGLSVKFSKDDLEAIKKILTDNEIDFKGIYHIDKKEDGTKEVNEII
ncbi:DUF3343 domain-containing protein [Metaclostridioides mangenotii]|jgi:hypothetical protein|uniref:Putative Se/S carrier protein-like domain-containing protein n=1 Tax=Metaclostridioides mangenotii TaxID=1540 RepID=A0ABS4EF44_9FIRM|nr:DUF3343 domain-containing protein [Clostridioides mangenotii]MBP1856491.1 hypothetical protein [Clostridioides mangenotii]